MNLMWTLRTVMQQINTFWLEGLLLELMCDEVVRGHFHSLYSQIRINWHEKLLEKWKSLKKYTIKNSVGMFVKNEFIDDEKIEKDVLKKFCENVKFVDGNYEVSLPFIPWNEMIGDIIC